MPDFPIRLNKFLANKLGISRRQADELISSGQIILNGSPAPLGAHLDKNDNLCYNGNNLSILMDFSYYAFHKPTGYVCSRRQQGDSPTIYSLLPKELQSMKTVGRLDRDSSGLILLTNDGDFAYQMTHPKFAKTKIYEVELDRPLEPLHQQMIADFGVEIGDGPSKLGLTRQDDARTKWEVTMSEGRNRQIRRTFAALGYQVTRLHRTTFGPYKLDGIREGETREILTRP